MNTYKSYINTLDINKDKWNVINNNCNICIIERRSYQHKIKKNG